MYMAKMVRKQVYIEVAQDRRLKRLARARGQTEAALIREALDALADRADARGGPSAPSEPLAIARQLYAMGPLPARKGNWTRADIYDRG